MASPEKEDRYYTTRGSLGFDDNGKVLMEHVKEDKPLVWPKLFVTLSSKEKEEDFMAMKGCKLPQRPKKRAKLIQRSLLVSLLIIPVRNFLF
jgi:mRNA deadenylase 3'-5' endonuclease subunit Ccr4